MRVSVGILVLLLAAGAAAGDDAYTRARTLHDEGGKLLEEGGRADDDAKVREGAKDLQQARVLYLEAQKSSETTEQQLDRIRAALADLDERLRWYEQFYGKAQKKPGEGADAEAGGGQSQGEEHLADPEQGALLGAWCRDAKQRYETVEDPKGRAQIAREIASHAGVVGLPTLLDLFDAEDAADAQEGIRDALVSLGGPRVAKAMAEYASDKKEARRDEALEVIYAALDLPESKEPERPWCEAIRKYHEKKDRRLTLRILERLHAMGPSGVAALGEVLYVDDFGYHEYTISLLAKSKDGRAVPPLVYKMNRFKFEYRVQMPAHQALIDLGWYAVPALIDRLDDRAAGIWISWTLRKITGETMGTTKMKWFDWWKHESVRHPELFEDPDARPPAITPSTPR